MYNKQTCIQQIYDIAKENGIKIGDLEKSAGVSAGYLSRISKEGNTSTLSVDLLVSIAEHLNVSVERLLMDTSNLSEGEKYISKFIDKLTQKTQKDSLEWQKQTLAEIRNYDYSTRRYPLPFFSACENSDSYGNVTYDVEYMTRFYDFGTTTVNGPCFWTGFGWEGAVVYLTSISHTEESDSEFPFPTSTTTEEFEVYIKNGEKLIPLCNTQFLDEGVAKQVESLYALIYNTQAKIGVNSEVKGLIDDFLQDGLPFN